MGSFPLTLPFVRDLDLDFKTPVTFLIGENGSGKSTLLEALVDIAGLPVRGGGRQDIMDHGGESELAPYLRSGWAQRPGPGFFFRAEFEERFASLLDSRKDDVYFNGDPYQRYGGRSLHERSHGEAFLHMMKAWMYPGILFMDEPESALSPQRQLTLLTLIYDMVEDREQILAAFSASGFALVAENDDKMVFQADSVLRRLSFLMEDEITVSQYGQWVEVKGIRRAAARVAYRLEMFVTNKRR